MKEDGFSLGWRVHLTSEDVDRTKLGAYHVDESRPVPTAADEDSRTWRRPRSLAASDPCRLQEQARPSFHFPLTDAYRDTGVWETEWRESGSLMEMVMCLSCGEFVPAEKRPDDWAPIPDECPACGAERFKHRQSQTVVRADD